MKLIKFLMLCFVCAFTASSAIGQANASLNILTLQGGQVVLGGTVNIQVTVGNTGPVSSITANKVRAQISVPAALVSVLPNAQQTGLPPGWTITVNTGSAITVCNGSDVIGVNEARVILIKVQGNTLGGPSTVNGNLLFSSGISCATPGSLSGDNTADNSSTSSVQVINATACNLAVSGSAGSAITCNGGTTTLTATATGAAGPVEYSVNAVDFQPGNTFTVPAGTYTVSVREVNNLTCTASSTPVTVGEPAAINASASAGVACFAGTTTLTVTATGGTGALQYSLNGGAFQAGNTFTVNAAGSPYVVTVRDANLCTGTSNSVTVTESSAITASASAGTIACNGGTTTLTVTASGGTAPLEYSLNGGAYQPGNTFTVNAAGSPYTVTVRDASLCTTTTNTVTVTQPTAITASASAGTIACNGGTTTLTVTASGGTGALQYSLNGGAFQAGNTFTVNAAGSPYTVTVRDANQCTATTNTVTVTQPTAINASASAGTIACFGGTTTLTVTASGGTAPLQYSLNGGTFQAGNTFIVNAAGSPYTVSVKDANLCTATTNTVTVTQPTALSATATSTPVTTTGGSDGTATAVPAGGTAPYTYSWAPGGQTTITATGLTAGSYTVTVTDANGCTTTATTTVGSPSCNITASASAGTIACFGGTTTLTVSVTGGTAPIQYSLNGGAFQAGNTFIVNAAGSPYTVSVKDANLCTATTNTVTVTQPTALSATATSTPVTTTGGSDGTATAVPAGGTAPYTYSWAPGGQTTVTATGLTAGSYTVTVTDANGCTTTATTTVGSPSCNITASASAGTIACFGGTTTLTVSVTGGTAPIQYSLNGGAFQAGNTFTVNAAGSPYTVSVKDANLCTATTNTVTVTQPTALSATATSTPVTTTGGSDGTATAVPAGGTAPYTYSWAPGGQTTVTATGLTAGSYTVTVTDANGCTTTATTTVGSPSCNITASASAGTIACFGGTTTLTVSVIGGTAPIQYSLNGGAFQAGNTFIVNAAGSPYTVSVKDANLCTATTNTVTVTQPTAITASASAGTIACFGGTTTLTVTASGGTAPLQYSLNGGAFQAGNTFIVNAAGSPYTVSVRDANLCTATTNTVTVGQPTALSATATSTPVTTTGGSDGTATAVPAGGTAPYTYSWAPGGQTTITATGLTAGSYTVTVTDANGCTTTATTTVGTQGPTPLAVTIAKNNLSSCGGTNDGSITVTATGGTAPYTYSWTGQTGSNQTPFTAGNVSSISNLNYGFYNVTVTDAVSSTVTVSNIHVEFAFAVYITHSGSNSSSCANTGTILLYGNAGVKPYTYSIDGTNYQASNTFTNLAAATYTGYVKDAAGCVSTKPNIVIGAAAPIVVTPYARRASSCGNDGSIEIYRSGGIPPYTYSLNNVTYVTGNIFTGLAAGPYTAYVKDSKGCVGSQAITVAQGVALTVSANYSNTSTCVNDGTIQVNVSGGVAPYTFSLNGGAFQAGNSFAGLAANTYTVTVKDTKGCLGTINVTIGTNTITVTANAIAAGTCSSNDGKITLFRSGGVGPYTYSIDGNIYQGSSQFTGVDAGTYTGYVKDSKMCVGSLAGIVVGPLNCPIPPAFTTTRSNSTLELTATTLKLNAYPNPSAAEFNLVLEGFNSNVQVSVTVTDLLGRIVYQTTGAAKLQYKFGSNLLAGVYNVQVIQGNNRKALKLVKE